MRGPALDTRVVAERLSPPLAGIPRAGSLAAAAAALLAAWPVAWLIGRIHAAAGAPERAVVLVALSFAALLALAVGGYWYLSRDAGRVSVFALAAGAVLLSGIYFYWVRPYVAYPADILIWSEGDYVNDIAKFRAGQPIFGAPENNDSFTYPPGTQLLTYALASAAGRPTSVPAYRFIHVGYTLAAAWVALLAVRKALAIAGAAELASSPLWNVLWAPLLFLTATNSITNRFTFALHDDGLSELVTAVAFYLLLAYTERPRRGVLAAMAVLPAAAFLVKQSLVIWAGLFTLALLPWSRLGDWRAWKRPIGFGIAAFGLSGAVFAGCYALWGRNFVYWTITVVARHSVQPLLSGEHLLDVWAYVAAGLLGGWALAERSPRLLGPWLISLGLILAECYTSGVAWMLNHIGPGCLLAGVWLCAGLAVGWPRKKGNIAGCPHFLLAGVGVLLFSGLGLVRIPLPAMTADTGRYLHAIESQFAGERPGRVLIDGGSWITLRQGVVARDRVASIAERGWSGTTDFSGILGRIRGRYYDKILVHNLDAADFRYDEPYWPRRSGIRAALLENYRVAGTIPAAARPISERDQAEDYYLFSELTILVPKP